MKRLFASAAICALFASPAFAAGFAIINGGGTGGAIAVSASPATLTVTTAASTVDIPIGSLVVQSLAMRANASFTGCSDSVGGNTWTIAGANQQGSPAMSVYSCYSVTAVDLPIGTTFSATSGNTAIKSNIVAAFSGPAASPVDPSSVSGQNTSATTSLSIGPSGTWTCPGGTNCSLQIAAIMENTAGTVTETSGFTSLGTISGTQNHMAYQIVSLTTATTYTATLGTSSAYAGLLRGFEAATGGGAVVCRRSLLGVGC